MSNLPADAQHGWPSNPARPSPILRWFANAHLPDDLRVVSDLFVALAHDLEARLPAGDEKDAALRSLLVAKDAAVRATIEGSGPALLDKARTAGLFATDPEEL